MAAVTYYFRVQWSEVWNLPLWLWLHYVEFCRDYLAAQKAKEGAHG